MRASSHRVRHWRLAIAVAAMLTVLATSAARAGITITPPDSPHIVVPVGESGSCQLVTTTPDDPRTNEEKQDQGGPEYTWSVVDADGAAPCSISGSGASATLTAGRTMGGWSYVQVKVVIHWPCAPKTGPVPDTAYTATVVLIGYRIVTITVATTPADRARTKLGVGEEVTMILMPTSLGPVTWSLPPGNGALSSTSTNPTTFTAYERASSPTITATFARGSCNVSFNVVEPSEGMIEQTAGTGVWHVQGQASVGFKGTPFIGPDDVSFQNIQVREGTIAGVGEGYFLPDKGQMHDDGPWGSVGAAVAGKGSQVFVSDTISTGPHTRTPYVYGMFIWDIPWFFKVGTGAEKQFTTVQHLELINAEGDMTISKGGAYHSAWLNDPSSDY